MIVIGGGPAGSLAALLLARGGATVDLVEQHRFPRDKVCGECLSALGLAVLDRAGLTARLDALGPVRLVRTLIHPIDGPTVELPLPRVMWGLTRHQLDVALLSAAAEAGVTVHQPARCERITPGSPPSVGWRDLRTNARTERAADWVVVADGKGSLPPPTPATTGDLGIKAHFVNVAGPRDAIELFAGPGCYGGLAAVEGGRWNAAFAVPAKLVQAFGGDVGQTFDHICRSNPTLAGRLRTAERAGRWLAAALPRFSVVDSWPAGLVPVGNAAAALEPVGGEGMGLALRSAEMAAGALLTAPNSDVCDLAETFKALWSTRQIVCRSIGRAVAIPWLGDAIAPLAALQPELSGRIAGWAGKSAT